ncbi:MAG: glycosyl hydrolase family 38, partial [Isosphaeraceae bacterium]|nr:glycosyl hydrolase family 38 [Isosphaeraceae bacterium]
MSMPEAEPTEPQPDSPETPARREGWTLVALVAGDGCEPQANMTEREARGAWAAVSALWHPSLLARAEGLPRIESVEGPSSAGPREIRVTAAGTMDQLPSGYQAQAEDAGTVLIDGGEDRAALVRMIQERLGAVGTPETSPDEDMQSAAADFLALGTAHWFLKDLTIAMGHADALDHESLAREVLTGADAWQAGDRPTALNRLRAGFELLTQARERFYPVDAYIIDLCLLDPAMPAGVLADALAAHAPVTFLGPAQAVANQAERDPERLAALREAINEGWADVVGGAYSEVDEPLLPVESVLWQFRKGGEVYRAHLDDRNVETLARRRFGLYPQLPQFARRFGFRFGLHLGFDAGQFPIQPEAKRLWESHDGSHLESLLRPPLGADKAVAGRQLPWRLARTMRDDHIATLPLVHWPNGAAPWYADLRKAASYSPVLARWVTLNDYFHLTDRPFESFRPEVDQYVTPYLAQAVARKDPYPISRRAAHARLRARLDCLSATRAVARCLTSEGEAEGLTTAQIEESLETGVFDAARDGLDRQEPVWAGALAAGIVGRSPGGRTGYLVTNPVGVARRAAVLLPEAAADLRPEGPLRSAQFTDEGVWAVVDLPAFGYAWVPRESNVDVPPATGGALSARDRVLKNEVLRVEIDKATGGLRSICGVSEETARLGQQLVIHGLAGADGAPAASRMQAERIEVEYAGPALVQAVVAGSLLDPRDGRRLASFQQRFRLWTGRPVLEIDITLADLDGAWLERIGGTDPWSHYLAC